MHILEALGKSQIVGAGVDWLTVTAPRTNRDYASMKEWGIMHQIMQVQAGHEAVNSAPQGYHGMSAPGVFWGERKDGLMLRYSGALANRAAKEFIDRGYDGKITRVDFQTTVRAPEKNPKLASELRSLIRGIEAREDTSREISVTLFERARSGYSVALGSRTSQRYYRFYDKTAEQNGMIPENLWRHEVELKGDAGRECFGMLRAAVSTEPFAMAVVASHLLDLGVARPWSGDVEVLDIPTSYTPTTDEKRKRWLENHVGNSVRSLAENGHTAWLKAWFDEFTSPADPDQAARIGAGKLK